MNAITRVPAQEPPSPKQAARTVIHHHLTAQRTYDTAPKAGVKWEMTEQERSDHQRWADRQSYLTTLPNPELAALRDALEIILTPASAPELAHVIATIGASWPHAYQWIDQDTMDAHVELLQQDLAPFSRDTLIAVVTALRRSKPKPPPVSDIIRAASIEANPAAELLREVWQRAHHLGLPVARDFKLPPDPPEFWWLSP